MEIQISQYGKKWGFEIVSRNRHVVMQSTTCYTHKRNAVAAARTIAGSKLKVVVE
jgi:hypothetical protein